MTASTLNDTYFPELVFCLCAAVGTDTRMISDTLSNELRAVGYTPVPVRLSKLMTELPGFEFLNEIAEEDERIRQSMHAGNEIRRIVGHADAVARLALTPIRDTRAELSKGDPLVMAERHCFIVSSLKREEELDMLRMLFGQRLFLISVYEPTDSRIENLCRNIAISRSSSNPEEFLNVAEGLVKIDQKEKDNRLGQRLEDVFQKADVFLRTGQTLREDAHRFVQIVFRAPFITPNLDEILMFHARATARRSADLSRQVGAVIARKTGEILATGCNEVPRAGGGVNWDSAANSEQDYRDFKVGQDAAAAMRKEIVGELMSALVNANWLIDSKKCQSPNDLAHEALYSDDKPLVGTMVASLLEFGRIVHAEMAAICDAAMRGISIKEGTLYCTTFPCHMCARHIIAAGISRVVYIEPYPKSRAKKLYRRAIQVDQDRTSDEDSVKFESFVGIAPTRFLELFEMVDRKDDQGYAYSTVAPSGGPKCVASGGLVSGYESEYLATLGDADWSSFQGLQSGSAA
jgi:cytidine deaminase